MFYLFNVDMYPLRSAEQHDNWLLIDQ